MEMNDILNGLNSCDDNCCDSESNNNCCCGNNIGGNPGFNPGCGGNGGFGTGCGFGSWIWILLILFYCGCGCGGNSFLGGGNNSCGCNNNCGCNDCCCECPKKECCCNNNCCCNSRGNATGGGLLGNCSAYLFLLVILFLCNGWGGCNSGNCGGISPHGTGLGSFASNCCC
ncbi:hypothetical protein FDC58_08985 [Clostridium botulinum]|uniref:hypothetical protein n=1 Tax=Clostridium TaxID=1485 RepID=UPI0005059801|nr:MULTISPECIES: hypothetical protein [unclassified Clostridium]KFX57074.1 hypothetical protein KU41_11655 [Clostridium botulinum]MBN1039472.1 hypothetical protein [Clostridium botulinum]MBY6802348.1 hypothetical protein [Clostridium botulinum]MBY6812488.1 hypothetical protein [Clostridium botulinum]MBY6819407.1 hypothetical protein [Clostridium botulinum]